jgi:hypothetical protein
MDRGFVLGRFLDTDHVPVDGVVPVSIQNPSPNRTFLKQLAVPQSTRYGCLPVPGEQYLLFVTHGFPRLYFADDKPPCHVLMN